MNLLSRLDAFVVEHKPQEIYWDKTTIKTLAEKAGLTFEEKHNGWKISTPPNEHPSTSFFSFDRGDEEADLGVQWTIRFENRVIFHHITYHPVMVKNTPHGGWTRVQPADMPINKVMYRLLVAAGISNVKIDLPEAATRLPIPQWCRYDYEYCFASEASKLLKQFRVQITYLTNRIDRIRSNPAAAE